MTQIDLKSLGFTQEELQEKVIERLCAQFTEHVDVDPDEGEWTGQSAFAKALEKKVQEHIDVTVSAIAEAHVLPKVSEYIEHLVLQETNKWGEKHGEPVTFVEYLTKRAEEYLLEKVDYDGKGRPESRSSFWEATQTRVGHMIHRHLHYEIEAAMKEAVSTANSAIVDGIQKTTVLKLREIAKKLKVTVKT